MTKISSEYQFQDKKYRFDSIDEINRYIDFNSDDPIFAEFIQSVLKINKSRLQKDRQKLIQTVRNQEKTDARQYYAAFVGGHYIYWLICILLMVFTKLNVSMLVLCWPFGAFFIGWPLFCFLDKFFRILKNEN